jgi:hypothetical protein
MIRSRFEKSENSQNCGATEYFERADIKKNLNDLQEITIEDRGKTLAIRSECLGTCGKVFQAAGVAIPPTIREVA